MSKCQFLFSAVFGFRNPTQEIFSETDVTKTRSLIFVVAAQRTEADTKRSIRATTPPPGVAWPWPAPGAGGATLATALRRLFAYLISTRVYPKYPSTIPRKSPTPSPSSTLVQEGSEADSGTLPEGKITLEAFFIAMMPSKVMCE